MKHFIGTIVSLALFIACISAERQHTHADTTEVLGQFRFRSVRRAQGRWEKGYSLRAEGLSNAGQGMTRVQRGFVGAGFGLFFIGVFFLGWGMRACAIYDPWLALQAVGLGSIVYGLPALVFGFVIGYVAPIKLEVTAALSSTLIASALCLWIGYLLAPSMDPCLPL